MAATTKSPDRDLYFELIQRFPLRRIHSDAELDQAIAIIDELIGRQALAPGELDYLDVLSDQVHKYETAEHPIPSADDADVLRYLMDSCRMNQVQMADVTKIPVSTISEVLAGKRGLSKHNIGVLSRHFHINPAVFSFE